MTLLSNNANSNEGELWIYGDIVDKAWEEDDVTPSVVRDALKEMGSVSVLNMHVNSYGGSVPDGNAIIGILNDYRRKNGTTINAYIEGIAASMGSGIPMVADKIYMASNALMMIHKPSLLTRGNIDDLNKAIEVLQKNEDILLDNYMHHFKGSREELEDLMAKETWLTAEEALDCGLCDEIIPGIAIAASAKGYVINKQQFSKLPEKAVAKLMPMPMAMAKEPPTISDKGVDKVNENFSYDEDLKAFGITEDKFKELGVNAETALIIAKTSANTVMPKDNLADVSSVVITKEDLVDKIDLAEDNTMLSKNFLLDRIQDGMWCFEENCQEKVKSYDKLVENAIEETLKSGVRAKGDGFNEQKWRKLLNSLDYTEILDQQKEWEAEAEFVLNAGKRISQMKDVETKQDLLINPKDYEIFMTKENK